MRFRLFAALMAVLCTGVSFFHCGGDKLCERAWDRQRECEIGGYSFPFCYLSEECRECIEQQRAFETCLVEAESCDEARVECGDEKETWSACLSAFQC